MRGLDHRAPAARSSVFRHPLDRYPAFAATVLFAADLAVYFGAASLWVPVAWWMGTFWLKAQLCAWNHHHQHRAFFGRAGLNRAIEIVFGLQTGVSPFGWVLHHNLGHHETYLDQRVDQARWRSPGGRVYGPLSYGTVTAVTRYWRSFLVGRDYPKVGRRFLAYLALQSAILIAAFVWSPRNAVFVFALPMACGLLVTSVKNHGQHSGLDTPDEYAASRNILSPSFNFFTGNLGFHTAHHFRPELHWSKLDGFHAEIAGRIPAHCYSRAGFPYDQMDALWGRVREPRPRAAGKAAV